MVTGTVVVVVLVVIVVEATVVGSLVVEACSGVFDLPIATLELVILSSGVKDEAFTIFISVVELVANVVFNDALLSV